MNIGGFGKSVSGLSSAYPVERTQALQGDGDNDSTGEVRRTHGHLHGGGQMQQDLTSALDSIGLTVPGGGAPPPPPDGATSSDRGADSSVGADRTIQTDMKQFLQALGQAVQGQSGSSSATTNSSAGSTSFDPKAGFASGLSALISQVAGGQAPQGLQDAFTRLVTDLTTADAASSTASFTPASTAGSGAASTDATGTTAASSTANTQATLQAFLTQLQQNIGYAGHRLPSVGNLLSTQV